MVFFIHFLEREFVNNLTLNSKSICYYRVYDKYSFQVIPPMGELIAGDWKSYQYLIESIRKFPTQVN